MDNFNLYNDIKARTGGEIYLGIVGPVRTGKSTFIRRFMDIMVIPAINDVNEKRRIIDELPQAAAGKTVMTTEPKFIPKTAVEISPVSNVTAKFRLIDCVGYIADGVQGIYEDEKERQVKTPWYEESIPFTKAAEIGTRKVINDHSTIGIVITTDGSIGELPRESYLEAEAKTIYELKSINKPFIVIVNSVAPGSDTAINTAKEISKTYDVRAVTVNCDRLTKENIQSILTNILYEFPIVSFEFYMPKWVEAMADDNPIKREIIDNAREILYSADNIKDINTHERIDDCKYISAVRFDDFDFSTGNEKVTYEIDDKWYYEHLSELSGEKIEDEYELINMIKRLSVMGREYSNFIDAAAVAKMKGYGVVIPGIDEVNLSEPEIIKNGSKFGVRIKAQSPSVHMIKVDIATEISPIVGSEAQAEDLLKYINESRQSGNVWDTNIFGKTIGNLVEDGIKAKIQMLNDDCQTKLMDTMQKVVNETSGGLVCLII